MRVFIGSLLVSLFCLTALTSAAWQKGEGKCMHFANNYFNAIGFLAAVVFLTGGENGCEGFLEAAPNTSVDYRKGCCRENGITVETASLSYLQTGRLQHRKSSAG